LRNETDEQIREFDLTFRLVIDECAAAAAQLLRGATAAGPKVTDRECLAALRQLRRVLTDAVAESAPPQREPRTVGEALRRARAELARAGGEIHRPLTEPTLR